MDVILQDLFEMKTLLIPHKTAWFPVGFFWGLGVQCGHHVSGRTSENSRAIYEISDEFLHVYLKNAKVDAEKLVRTETYFKTVIHEKVAHNFKKFK